MSNTFTPDGNGWLRLDKCESLFIVHSCLHAHCLNIWYNICNRQRVETIVCEKSITAVGTDYSYRVELLSHQYWSWLSYWPLSPVFMPTFHSNHFLQSFFSCNHMHVVVVVPNYFHQHEKRNHISTVKPSDTDNHKASVTVRRWRSVHPPHQFRQNHPKTF